MRRLILAAGLGLVMGTFGGFALGIFVYPFWFLNDVAMERLGANEGRFVLAQGTFIHPDPSDPVHWGRGGVAIVEGGAGGKTVYLQPDFAVGPGPRFHVYLVERADIGTRAAFLASRSVDLGRLRAFEGSQRYAIPESVDPSAYASVVIWCKEFGVLISPATLRQAKVGA